LRGERQIRARADDDSIWLSGPNDPTTNQLFRALPGARRFVVQDDGQLVESGNRVPNERLPDGKWLTVHEFIEIEPPPGCDSFPSHLVCPALTVERTDGEPKSVNVLITTRSAWLRYGDAAPHVRLRPLRFSACDDGRVVVWGEPLPALPGEYWTEQNGVAVEAGWRWLPALQAVVLRDCLAVREGDLALIHRDGSYEHIDAERFAAARRSSIRLTAGGGE
jgi:hypothetical protein